MEQSTSSIVPLGVCTIPEQSGAGTSLTSFPDAAYPCQLDLYLSRYAPANSFTQFVMLPKNDGSVIVRCPTKPRAAVVALNEARNQMTGACRAMAVSCSRNADVLHRFVSFLDDVRRHVGMLRARHMITFTRDVAPIEFRR